MRQELSHGGACEVVFFFPSHESNDKEITEKRLLILKMIVGLGRGLSWYRACCVSVVGLRSISITPVRCWACGARARSHACTH